MGRSRWDAATRLPEHPGQRRPVSGRWDPSPALVPAVLRAGKRRDKWVRLSLRRWEIASARGVPDGQTAPGLPGRCFPGIQPWMLHQLPSLQAATPPGWGIGVIPPKIGNPGDALSLDLGRREPFSKRAGEASVLPELCPFPPAFHACSPSAPRGRCWFWGAASGRAPGRRVQKMGGKKKANKFLSGFAASSPAAGAPLHSLRARADNSEP